MSVKRLDKLPKRKVTVDEILGRDEISDIISDMKEYEAEIEDIVVIWSDGKNIQWHSNVCLSRLLLLLEQVSVLILL